MLFDAASAQWRAFVFVVSALGLQVALVRVQFADTEWDCDTRFGNSFCNGSFDIILDHLTHIHQLYPTLHMPCAAFYVLPRLTGC